MSYDTDCRPVLGSITRPALVLHRAGDRFVPREHGRYLADHIPGARYVELPGADHIPWADGSDTILDEIEEFLTGVRHGVVADRVLATVLFTDIVGSTERAAALGDRRWRDVLHAYYGAARRQLVRFRGRELDSAGDGLLAAFDGPARAIRCGCAIRDAVRPLGLEVRVGLHTGECEALGDKLSGIAVHIGARVAARAAGGEVLVSSTVRDLVAGSGIRFEERGVQALRGVPGEWRLFAVVPDS
jgi:class 3 adenylate cyclase